MRPMTTAERICFGAVIAMVAAAACGRANVTAPPSARPSILLVTLDTTRADVVGPDASGVSTPSFNAVAARGRWFRHAYATAPETLPSHSSIMTGLYPAGHGVHENGRFLAGQPVLAERLQQAGYRTAAFVSSFVLARRFGLARGFETYDDELTKGHVERSSSETTDRAIAYLDASAKGPVFLWVHYFDPHTPYSPPEPQRTQFAAQPYLGEVAVMDQQLGRLVDAFEKRSASHRLPAALVVAGDHGEGLGDHGELQHGNLLYQSTMRVPLAMAGPGVATGTVETPVSTRRIFHTVLDWAGLDGSGSLRASAGEDVVLGEAMKPFLEYGWQPQIMAVAGSAKAIFAGTTETYDLAADPNETRNLGSGANLPAAIRKALDDYPVPSPDAAQRSGSENLTAEAKRNLASLGYVSASATPVVRKDAPRPTDMVRLFEVLERASALFVQERYADAIPLLRQIEAEDPHNLDAVLRLATAHSALGQEAPALAAFKRAAAISPRSPDVRTYLALHYARGNDWPRSVPVLEQIFAETPDRLPVVEALATVREKQGRVSDAIVLRQKIQALRPATAPELVHLGRLAMSVQQTTLAIESFEKARALDGDRFANDLELGVLYLASRRFTEARDALDRIPASHPEYPMALFKRAQVSVLLKEPDSAARIALARKHADGTTRALIASEGLFKH
jgi:arylsulfatase A-like enzyme/Tfp pilus assembly protein PilF